MATRHNKGSRLMIETKEEKIKQFSAWCLIPVPEESTVYILAY